MRDMCDIPVSDTAATSVGAIEAALNVLQIHCAGIPWQEVVLAAASAELAMLRAKPEGKWTFGWHQVPADLGTVPAKITPVGGPRQGGQCPTAGEAVSSPDEAGGRQQTHAVEVE